MSNETDRELLDLAAKAAGINIDKSPYNGGGHGNTGFDCMGNAVLDWHNGKTWNPLADDGDALRLGAKLQLRTLCTNAGASAESTHRDHPSVFAWGERMDYSDVEASAATRRAIVRAAAEIGRAMK